MPVFILTPKYAEQREEDKRLMEKRRGEIFEVIARRKTYSFMHRLRFCLDESFCHKKIYDRRRSVYRVPENKDRLDEYIRLDKLATS